jgi:serine/threonine protein kinase
LEGFRGETLAGTGPWFSSDAVPQPSDSAKDFMTKALSFEPADRLSAELLLQHQFLSGAVSKLT